MWQFTNLDLFIGIVVCFFAGFGCGLAWWEWIKPERVVYDAGSSSDIVDIPVSSGPGGLHSNMGPGGAGHPNSAPGNENHLDHRGPSGNPAASPTPARIRN